MPEGREDILSATDAMQKPPTDSTNPADVLKEVYFMGLESSPDAIVIINARGEVVVFNHQAELMFGYNRAEVLGSKVEKLLPATLRATHVNHRDGYMSYPKVREMGIGRVLMGLHRSGKEFSVQISLGPLMPIGGPHAMAVIRRVDNVAEKI